MNRPAPRLLAAAALSLSLSPAASAAPHGIYRPGASPAASGNLQYYGGPVIPNAKVYAVFWGDAVPAETKSKVGPFFSNILNSTYMDWLSEYDTNLNAVDGRPGTRQHIGRGSFAGGLTITPGNTGKDLTDAQVQAELEEQIKANKLPASDGNSLYMVYFPKGVSITIEGQRSCSSFCAYHEGFMSKSGAPIFYGVMPVCGFGCGSWGETSSHEAIEAVTDPFPTPGDKPAYPQAWNTADGQEIADLCQSNTGTVNGSGGSSTVSGEWDNRTGACNTGPWSQNSPQTPRSTKPLNLSFKPAWALPRAW